MIYFIQPEGEPVVKIGYAKSDAAVRLKSLQCANHKKLRVLAAVEGSLGQERGLHFSLKALRVRGEWFRLTPEVKAIIAKAKKAGRYLGPTAVELQRPLKLKTKAQLAESNKRRGRRNKTRAERRMPWDQVRQLYFDTRLSNAELEAAVAKGYYPMTYHTMRRYFGRPRGAQVGRPSKSRKAKI